MRQFVCLSAAFFLWASRLHAEEAAAPSRIVSVSLFKNGLALVKREVTAPGPGTFRLDYIPEAVHGTYWVESPVKVESAVQMREVEVPAEPTGANLQEELAGKKVTVYFREDRRTPLVGTVLPPPKSSTALPAPVVPAWEEALAYRPLTTHHNGRFLILQTAKGRAYVEPGDIAYFEAENVDATVKRRKPVLLLTVGPEAKAETRITVSYLGHGLAWAPSYRVDTSDAKRLVLEQSAVVKNEMVNLTDAEMFLITGFPSVQFANVASPLSPNTSWAAFFHQLNQRAQASHAATMNVASQVAFNRADALQGPQVNTLPGHEGVDLYYHPIGKRTLAKGDALALTTRRGDADYERIVEWLIADHRDAFGNPTNRRREESETEEVVDVPWDALRFKNPFPFPMTTGPAMVSTHAKFSGQRLTSWVNAGEETTLRVTKALSVRTHAVENEQQVKTGESQRDVIDIGGRRFRRATVEGQLTVFNHRAEPVKLLIRRRFSGDLIKATANPKITLLEEGVYSVNKRNELVWTVSLKPAEELRLPYQYRVLVPF